jgi:uncharacterized protein with GYD domain
MNWTEQGIRNVKDAPKRAAQAREIAKKFGVEIKQTYLTNAKFCMQVGTLGNVRTRTMRAWPESEYHKLISELS